MAESTKETLGRLAKALRTEAGEMEAKQLAEAGRVKDSIKTDRDWQKGFMDGLNQSADLLDEGEGKPK